MPRLPTRLASLLTAVLSALAQVPAAVAADVSVATSAADIRWACEQPYVARVRLTSIGLQVPDAPCAQDTAGTQAPACSVVVAQAVVLDALPSIGGYPGLSLIEPGPFGKEPFRVSFRLMTRDANPPIPPTSTTTTAAANATTATTTATTSTPPVDMVGMTGLIALPEFPSWGGANPAKWTVGTFLPDAPATTGDLDGTCKPYRHWSGLRSAAMPEQLPGDFPARREGSHALGKRIAALIGPTPPDVAAIERSFGARMVAPSAPRPNGAQTRTLARLSQQWVRITHELYTDRPGPPGVTLSVHLSGAQIPSRRAPWWEADPSDGGVGDCVTASMIVDQVGDGWGFSRISQPYRGRFMRSFTQYSVHFEFSPPYIASFPDDRRVQQSECVKAMYVYYSPSSGS
ncbi:hypothetical protein [Mitsuaria sp. 7]|uniref:hypothetical protein n=1 Tax=Mitsuaria sp. 7 TaxID=1658665 RepID=UPI0007DDA613|nr:hypothetical protein [Mitsuaria sp. 7]ANH66568.1 hypothetical protein ABE85_01530 [Mitsuaria sp. 7]